MSWYDTTTDKIPMMWLIAIVLVLLALIGLVLLLVFSTEGVDGVGHYQKALAPIVAPGV